MPRCAFREKGRQCLKNGIGNPALCRAHRDEVDARNNPSLEEENADPFEEFLAQPEVRGLFSKVSHAFDKVGQILDRVSTGAQKVQDHADRARAHTTSARARVPHAPPPPSPPPPRPAHKITARDVLGFRKDVPLTEEMIKQRRKDLGKIYHTDRGASGNEEKMKQVNQACDILLAQIKKAASTTK